ncbi:MAG: sugar phosphate nucleotidyltransferase [Bacteroidetes bacterium]|nr:sugar phosphate nucleotidyltransferase [Bacteroidota bacterium]
MKAAGIVILAGGVSSRMREALAVPGVDESLLREAEDRPKGMLSVGEGRRPFLDYLLYNVRAAGITDVVIVVGEQDRSVRERYGAKDRDNHFHGLSIAYAVQRIPAGRTKPLGTADAVLTAMRVKEDWHGRSFVVCNSDNLYSVAALRAMDDADTPGALVEYDRAGLGLERSRVDSYATIVTGADGHVKDIVEKPSTEELAALLRDHPGAGVSMNIYRLPYRGIEPILGSMPLHPERGEKELPTAVGMLVRRDPQSVLSVPMSEPVPDLTRRTDIAAVQQYLMKVFASVMWEW